MTLTSTTHRERVPTTIRLPKPGPGGNGWCDKGLELWLWQGLRPVSPSYWGSAYWRLAYVYESGKRVHVRKYAQKLAKEALT